MARNAELEDRITKFTETDYCLKPAKNGAAVYLIAQLGKNFALPKERRISGADLLLLALEKFRTVKSVIGGKLVSAEGPDGLGGKSRPVWGQSGNIFRPMFSGVP